MGYALSLTMILAGSVLIYSGFKDKGVWNGVLTLIRGNSTPNSRPGMKPA